MSMQHETRSRHRYDVVIVGGGHNGLIAAAYLARAGLGVAVLEAREAFGGPCGTFEFMPGYRTSLTNSPGSFEPRFYAELDLPRFGLRFADTNPTVLHSFGDRYFVGYRDRERLAAQVECFAAGESVRQNGFVAKLEELGRQLFQCGLSPYAPPPTLSELAERLPREHRLLFERVFFGSLEQLLDEELKSRELKAILGMVAINTVLLPPSAPGTAVGLMLRPLSLAASAATGANDPRLVALRGSTGLPIGGMGAIVEALVACGRAHGVDFFAHAEVAKVLHRDGSVRGVVTSNGDQFYARNVISTINPKTLFSTLLDDDAVGATVRQAVSKLPMRGSAFKMALALDCLPTYANLPAGTDPAAASACQFRYARSLEHIGGAVADGLRGACSEDPIVWGLIPSVTSRQIVPPGRHLMSVNVWHAPYRLARGKWETEREVFGQRCIELLDRMMPGLKNHIVGHRFMGPVDLEKEFGLVESNITHGDMLPFALLGGRPHAFASNYRTPLDGLYLSGAGTWPGGYVTGIPGYNASRIVIDAFKAYEH